MTFLELRDKLNSMPDEQLCREAVGMVTDSAGKVKDVVVSDVTLGLIERTSPKHKLHIEHAQLELSYTGTPTL